MELSRISAIIIVLLECVFCQLGGDTKVIPDDKASQYSSGSCDTRDVLDSISSNNAIVTKRSNVQTQFPSGNFTVNSIADVLNKVTSNNIIVNITTGALLSSKVTFEGHENITIIGHRNPVVKCNDAGAIKFISCKNVTIKGIQWEGCGSINFPGIEFYNSSDVSFESCSFYNSIGRSVLLSKVSGIVKISSCNFTHNKYSYRGRGAAIHYSPNTKYHVQHKVLIQNSYFIFNKATLSIVYIAGPFGSRITIIQVYLQDNTFINNTGVPLFVTYSNVTIQGILLFKNNAVISGGGIHSEKCNVIFYEKSNVTFINNSATGNGGAIYFKYSRIIFRADSIVTFNDNNARHGGAVYIESCNVIFSGTSIFNSNEASVDGGAIHCTSSSHITFNNNSSATFINNQASDDGGAVYFGYSSHITFDGNSNVIFNNNEASVDGGAVYCGDSSNITFDDNSSVTFDNNKASIDGGAVYCKHSSRITFYDNSSVIFNNNKASCDGGAVCCQYSSHITFYDNSSVTFKNNKAMGGGAVYCFNSFYSIYKKVLKNGTSDGGAVYCHSLSHITFDGNSIVSFNNNEASDGGAFYCRSSSRITFDGNSSVTFNSNEARNDGGAVACYNKTPMLVTGNSSVHYTNNKGTNGSAIYSDATSSITFDRNSKINFDKSYIKTVVSFSKVTIDGNSFVRLTNINGLLVLGEACIYNNDNFDNIASKTFSQSIFYSASYISLTKNSTLALCGTTIKSLSDLNNVSNAIVYIPTDLLLTSMVALSNLDTITIIGKRDIMIYCKMDGGFKCDNCSNATLVGIKWQSLGSMNKLKKISHTAIGFYNSSDISIADCSFHRSAGQAVVMSNMSGNVYISNCNFTRNNHNGSIHYSSSTNASLFTIKHCQFSFNNVSKSVIYLDGSNTHNQSHILVQIQNSTFINNIGAPVYTFYTELHLSNTVLFKNNKAEFGGGIYSDHSIVVYDHKCEVNFEENSVEMVGGAIYQTHSTQTFKGNSISTFVGNRAEHCGGAIFSESMSNITIDDSSQVMFSGNVAIDGGAVCSIHSSITFSGRSTATFSRNYAFNSGGGISVDSSQITTQGSSRVNFDSNNASFAGTIYSNHESHVRFGDNSEIMFIDNHAVKDGGAVLSCKNSKVTFYGNTIVIFNRNFANNGGAILSRHGCTILYIGNSTVTFYNNTATTGGGGVYCDEHCAVSFDGGTSVTFTNNSAKTGGAYYCRNHSYISCEENSSLTLDHNNAVEGGALYFYSMSHITIKGRSNVEFLCNEAIQQGGAMYLSGNAELISAYYSNITFENNSAQQHGGAVSCSSSSRITFDGYSCVKFNNNKASNDGGAVYCLDSSTIRFVGNSIVTLNIPPPGNFDRHLVVNLNDIILKYRQAAIFASDITFDRNSFVNFIYNKVYILTRESTQLVSKQCSLYNKTNYHRNNSKTAERSVLFFFMPQITLTGNSLISVCVNFIHSLLSIANSVSNAIVYLENNTVTLTAIITLINCDNITIIGKGHTTINCNAEGGLKFVDCDNVAIVGLKWQHCGSMYNISNPAIMLYNSSSILVVSHSFRNFTGQALVLANVSGNIQIKSSNFTHNNYYNGHGAAIYFTPDATVTSLLTINQCNFSFNKRAESIVYLVADQSYHSLVQNSVFISNKGVPIYILHGNLHLRGKILFKENEAESGGGIYGNHSTVVYDDKCKVSFEGNSVRSYGGAIYQTHSTQLFVGGTTVSFIGNRAGRFGGAIYLNNKAIVTFNSRSIVTFSNNTAVENGGALHLSSNFTTVFHNGSYISFYNNSANHFGGAIYGELLKDAKSKIIFNTKKIKFGKNTALTGPDVYIDVPGSCDETCLKQSIIGINNRTLSNSLLVDHIITPPIKLEFHLKCVDNQTNMSCNIYMMKNVMLGQELMIDACIRDYYDHPADATQLAVRGGNNNHRINGSRVLLYCAVFQGIQIIGERIYNKENFSMTVTSNHGSKSDFKMISVQLIVELSPCHPGFYFEREICVCYSYSDVLSCSGSTSSIKRGYWFGEVDNIATVSVCPNSYCNFSCCETANGFYMLSPDRANQCNSQRSGPACGSCKNGYSLSFDSIECVSIDKCTTGQTVLVVTLSMIYWIVIVILVFIMTYYHFGIGYLYAVTYYYSMVDILLHEHLYISRGLFTVVSIMSSIAKVTPQFLGEMCLVVNMSGIDQQFIHYVHPLAVAVIIIVISLSARISYKISSFVSRGIIHMICFLLLLSYTSVATTSLLLLRSLIFDNVDKVYTYLSPDIEYFHGRHLPYALAAISCTLVIVIGLPLLLLLEPFLNRKVNFTRIKPLLDQFQGCYKDKYRSFGAYYMICRLIIIVIIISLPSNNDTSRYLLIITNSTLSLIHTTLKPYESSNLNLFDGFVLHLMIVVSMVPFIDTYNKDVLVTFIVILAILPLVTFLILEIYLSKKRIKTITAYCIPSKPGTTNANNEVPMRDFFDSVIDDSRRVNATICTIGETRNEDVTCYRESFIEVMNEIED